MAFSLITSAKGSGNATAAAVTSSFDSTGANLLVASGSQDSAVSSNPSFTDSKGNTYTELTTYGSSGVMVTLAYVYAPTVGSGHTVTFNGTGTAYPAVCVMAWSGAASGPFDAENGAGGSASSIATGSITPEENSELIVSGFAQNTVNSATINAGMSIAEQSVLVAAQSYGSAIAYVAQTTFAAINPTWTLTSGSGTLACAIASFRAARAASLIPYTTGLTLHTDASETIPDTLWQNWEAPSPYHNTPVIANDDPVDYWDDEQSAGYAFVGAAGTTRPLWKTSGINSLPALAFDGTNDWLPLYNDSGGTGQTLGTVISASAYTLFVSFRVTADASNETLSYDNDGIISDVGGYSGLFLKTNGGVTSLIAYNWDGNEDTVSINISQNTDYVAMVRHESGTLYLSVNGGAESSVASGNTSNTSGAVIIGRSGFKNTNFAPVIIGEIAAYNAALTGSNFTDVYNYFTDKWLPTAGGSVGAGLLTGLKFNRIRLVS